MLIFFQGGGYSFGVRAEKPGNTWAFQNNGEPVEQDGIKLKETAVEDTYDKDTYGEFDVKLEVEGDVPIVKSEEKLDVVLAIDRSNSMKHNKRMVKAKAAAAAFIDKLLTDGEGKVRTDDKVKVGLVGFGGVNQEKTEPVLEFSPLSNNPSNLKEAVNGYTYYPAGLNSGATFTQAGLMKAYEILQDNNGHNKAIVLISDGEPTYAYKDENHNKVIGNGYDWYLKTIRETTIAEAEKIKGNNVTMYSLGVGVIDKGKKVLQNIATSADYYSDVDDAADNLNAELDKVADKIKPSIVNADIELKMNDMVEFNNSADLTQIKVEIKGADGADQDVLTAKADAIKKTVAWDSDAKTLSFGDITLDKDEVLNITYKAKLVEAHRDGNWKALNAAAVLYTEGKAKDSNKKLNFIIPEVKDKIPEVNDIVTTSIIVNKKWEGKIRDDIKSVTFNVFADGKPTNNIVTVEEDSDGKWTGTIALPKYNNGREINYTLEEQEIDGYERTIKYEKDTNGNFEFLVINKNVEKNTFTATLTKEWEGGVGNEVTFIFTDMDGGGSTYTTKLEKNQFNSAKLWSGTVSLPKYNSAGGDAHYLVTEKEIKGFTSNYPNGTEISADQPNVTFINTKAPITPDPNKPETPGTDTPDPNKPETPDTDTPTNPNNPVLPVVPSTPDNPSEPSTPGEPSTPTEPDTPVAPSVPPVNPPIDVPFIPDRIINEELIPEGDPVFDIVNEGDTPLGKAKVDKKEKTYTFIDDDKAPKGVAKIHDDNTLEVLKVFDDKTPQGRLPKTGGNSGNRLILVGVALLGLGMVIRKKIR